MNEAQQDDYQVPAEEVIFMPPPKALNLIYFEVFSAQMHIL